MFAVQWEGGRCGSVQCRHVRRGKTSDVKLESERNVLVCYITVGWVARLAARRLIEAPVPPCARV